MADLVINYSLLHQLAGDMRTLRSSLEADLRMAGGGRVAGDRGPADPSLVGDYDLYLALAGFFAAGVGPFNDALDALEQLGTLFGDIANAYFNADAELAGGAMDTLAGLAGQDWAWRQAEYEQYLAGNWPEGEEPPPDPGAAPGEPLLPDELADRVDTQTTYDSHGRVLTQTSTVTTPDGQTYTRTTTYDYQDVLGPDGEIESTTVDFDATVTYAGGETATMSRQTNPDGSFTVTETFDGKTRSSTVTPGEWGGYTQRDVAEDGTVTTTTVEAHPDEGPYTKTVVGPNGTYVYSGSPSTDEWHLEEYYNRDGIGGPLLVL